MEIKDKYHRCYKLNTLSNDFSHDMQVILIVEDFPTFLAS